MQNVAPAQIGDEGVAALAKAHEGAPLLGHVAHTQPRFAAVAPVIRRKRGQPLLRLHLAIPPQHVGENLLFHLDLGGRVQMLEAAPTADTEMGTARRDSLRRGIQHLGHRALVIATLNPRVAEHNPFAGQGPMHEHRLAVHMGQPAAVVGQGLDLRLDGLGREGLAFSFGQICVLLGGISAPTALLIPLDPLDKGRLVRVNVGNRYRIRPEKLPLRDTGPHGRTRSPRSLPR